MTAEDIIKHQYKPGESGNLKGRPKGSGVTDRLRALLDEEVDLGGKKMTMAEALAKVVVKKALKGDHKFVKELLDRTEGKVSDKLELEGEISIIEQRFVIAKKPGADDANDHQA